MASKTAIVGTKWTEQQRRAIETVGRNLLVSAAAGSGKTAVLAERCAHLVCDAPEPHRCEVDQLLVVTFTKAAAGEMRDRIGKALRRRFDHDAGEDARLARQIALLDRAQISTLHGFCSSLLRQHFSALGIDPNFITLAEDEATLLRNEVARALFADRYEKDVSGEFQRFVDQYGDGNDQPLVQRVIRTHHLLCSMVDRDNWIATAQQRIAEAIERPLQESTLGRELVDLLKRKLRGFYIRCRHVASQLSRMSGFEEYVAIVADVMAMIEVCEKSAADLDVVSRRITEYQTERLSPLPGDMPGKARAVKLLNSVRDELTKDKGSLYRLARFTAEQWRDGLTRIGSSSSVFLRLLEDFESRYRAAKSEQRALDFADLERSALKLLCDNERKPSAIAKLCRGQFRHVLVDEYQDINAVQDAILAMVSDESHPQTPNLFCVGDVKQSIYGFRLAEPARFLLRDRRFRDASAKNGEVIDLQKNFRSRAPLLDSINRLFRRLMTAQTADLDYDTSHELFAGADFAAASGKTCFSGAPIEVHLLPKAKPSGSSDDEDDNASELDRIEREAAFVAHRINQLLGRDGASQAMQICEHKDGKSTSRPIQPRDIVVLLRSMKHKSDDFSEQLRLRGIAVHSDSATGFFQQVEVRDILALLRLLDNQRQDVAMAAVLRSPLSGLPHPDDCLARIRLAYPDVRAVAFHQAVVRYADEQQDELAAELRQFLAQLRDWREAAHRRPLAELLWQIYDQTGYLAFCAGLDRGQQRVANLVALHERAREFGHFQRQGLGRFMGFLKTLEEESDLGQPSVASEADDVVRVMSIHHSKGLEFPVVFIADLGKRHNLMDTGGAILADRNAYLGLMACDEEKRIRYPSLPWILAQDNLRRQSMAEELRVLYVAMTRAREHLIMVGTCEPDSAAEWRDAWSDHRGPLPPDEVTGATTMLDWIGPAAAAIAAENANAFEIHMHEDEGKIAGWAKAQSHDHGLSEQQKARAALEPILPAPPREPAAERILQRVGAPYAFEFFARQPAARSVTSLTKTARSDNDRTIAGRRNADLRLPRFVSEVARPADIGSATHLVLQHLDFASAGGAAEIARQIQQLVARKLILPEQAVLADADAIAWVAQTDLGRLLRNNSTGLLRELPIYYPSDTDSTEPMDRTMIRGRIDVLIPAGDGIAIADYKTDQVSEAAVEGRMKAYRDQMLEYRGAIRRITGRESIAAYIAFLKPRILRQVE